MEVKILDQVDGVLRSESNEIRDDLRDILLKLESGFSLGPPHVKPLGSIHPGLHEIRLKDKRGQFRVIYLKKKMDAIYLVHAFRKRSQKMPLKEKRLILKRIKGL